MVIYQTAKLLRGSCFFVPSCKRQLSLIYKDGYDSYHDAKIEAKLKSLEGGSVQLSTNDGNGIALLKLNNPSKKNAFSGKMICELRKAAEKLSLWECGKALIVYGAEHSFCSGADLATVRAFPLPEDGEKMCMYMQNTLTLLQSLPLISVALVEGKAIGGGAELLTAFDFRLIHEDAEIQFIHKKMGLIPGWGGVTRLLQLVGREKTLELLASARKINAQKALQIGLVQHVIALSQKEIFSEIHAKAKERLEQADDLPRNLSTDVSPHAAVDWLQNKFDLENTDFNVLKAIKSSVAQCSQLSNNDSLKCERDIFKSVWGARANLNALGESRHSKS